MEKVKFITLGEIDEILHKLYHKYGYFTYPFGEYPCCQSCGVYEAVNIHNAKDTYLFFNYQSYQNSFNNYSNEAFDSETGEAIEPTIVLPKREDLLFQDLGLSWGDGVDPEIVKTVFASFGITVKGGDPDRKLVVDRIRLVNEEVVAPCC